MDFQHIEATFGKLEHRSLSFSKGLNIIEAPNESGKSTLLAFLRVMLYGFPPRERGALADKNRYAPWSLSPMRGTLALTCQKGNITLQRDTARANSPMGRFSAVYTGSGEAVDGLTAADCGETLLGVPCEVYERSAFIRQSSLKELLASLLTAAGQEFGTLEQRFGRMYQEWGIIQLDSNCDYLTEAVLIASQSKGKLAIRKEILQGVAEHHNVTVAAVDSGLRRLIDALETRQMPAWKAFKGKTHLAGQKVTAGKLIYTLRAQISQEYGY